MLPFAPREEMAGTKSMAYGCRVVHLEPESGPPAPPNLYALYGVSQELDLRPLHFVEPPPQARICSACGLVLLEAGLFPCGHVLCRPCYDRRPHNARCRCPLDSEVCPDEDVEWKEFAVERLMRRQVRCWNEANGCGAVVALSQICEHFRQDCRHHSTRCPKCSARVLWRELPAHLVSLCSLAQQPGLCSDRLVGSSAEKLERPKEFIREGALQCTGSEKNVAAEPSTEQRGLGRAPGARMGPTNGLDGERAAFGVAYVGHKWLSAEELGAGLCGLQQSIVGAKETPPNEFRQLEAHVLRSLETRLGEQTSELTELLEMQVGRLSAEFGRYFTENNIRQNRISEHLHSPSAFREIVKEELEEMSKVQKSMLEEHSQSVNSLRESVERQLREIGRQSQEGSAKTAADISGLGNSATEEGHHEALTGVGTELQRIGKSAKTHEWVLKGYASLIASAIMDGSCCSEGQQVYLCGYYMSFGLFFRSHLDALWVHLFFRLHKGEMDEGLGWPFTEKIRLSIIHPCTQEKPFTIEGALVINREFVARPMSVLYSRNHLLSDDLQRYGYVERDQLLLKFEIIS